MQERDREARHACAGSAVRRDPEDDGDGQEHERDDPRPAREVPERLRVENADERHDPPETATGATAGGAGAGAGDAGRVGSAVV